MAIGDLNGNEVFDVAVANGEYSRGAHRRRRRHLWRGEHYATGRLPQSVAIGDFNGDRTLDLAVTNISS